MKMKKQISINPSQRTTISLGRADDNTEVINDTSVSSYHAQINVDFEKIILKDLNSTNGVYYKKKKITSPVQLNLNDEFYIGKVLITVNKGAKKTLKSLIVKIILVSCPILIVFSIILIVYFVRNPIPGKLGYSTGGGGGTFNIPQPTNLNIPQKKEMTPEEIADLYKDKIVKLHAYKNGSFLGIGTGFLISRKGLIATNYHVIYDCTHMKVEFMDGTSVGVDTIVAKDRIKDIAILKINSGNVSFVPMLAESGQIQLGEPVITIGHSLGILDYSISNGLVSSVRGSEFRIIQSTAPISTGNSGGPLINKYGEVIGVNSFYFTKGQNLNFAISTDIIWELVGSRLKLENRYFSLDN